MAAGRFRISASRPWWDLHPLGGSLPRTRSAVGAGHPSARGIPLSLPSFLLPFVRLKHCPGRFPKPSSRASPPARSGFQPFSLPAELHRPPLYYYYHYFFFFLSSFFVGCFLRKLTRSRGGAGAARSCPPQPGSAPAPRGVAGPLLRAGGRAGERGGNFFRVGWRGEGRGWGSGREVSAPGNVSWQQSDGRFPAGRRVSLRSRPGLGGSPRSAAPTRGERGAAGGRD